MIRWIALLLLLLNVVLFWSLTSTRESRVQPVQEGRLPRIAEIQLIDEQGRDRKAADVDEDDLPVEPGPEESAGRDALVVATPGRNSPPAPVVEPVAVACTGVGWFDSEREALDYRESLLEAYPSLQFYAIRERSEPLSSFHWVIVPPLPSRDQALALYRELAAAGVEAYVVPSGEHENAISLGLFRSRESAERVLAQRQAGNINATLVNFPRNRISYALVFRGMPVSGLADTGASVPESDAGIQLIEFSDCEGVATAEKNP